MGEGKMGFLDHLDELRSASSARALRSPAGMLVAFFFVDRLGDFILAPTLKTLPAGDALIYTKPGEGFAFYLDIAFHRRDRARGRRSSCIRSGGSSRRACTRREEVCGPVRRP